MPKLDRADFKYNAKVFEKTCLWCGTIFFASRSTAKYCSGTCRGYANQAKQAEEAVPYDETEKMISALLSENAYLKGQIQRYVIESQILREELAALKATQQSLSED
ncbi:hypothetical protein [Runella zeae]|jgi:hypothetical protein|uniref:hypothetical protein n=1 Tax=Runella zeae TaxID=94255 RepID=UPI0003F5FF73|nr:hypothetical protein [Runella zeae]